MPDVFGKVKAVIVEVIGDSRRNITPETRLLDDLDFDDLDFIDVCVDLEEQFFMDVTDAEMESWRTVQDIMNTCIRLDNNRVHTNKK